MKLYEFLIGIDNFLDERVPFWDMVKFILVMVFIIKILDGV
jgi:hypothetical protein